VQVFQQYGRAELCHPVCKDAVDALRSKHLAKPEARHTVLLRMTSRTLNFIPTFLHHIFPHVQGGYVTTSQPLARKFKPCNRSEPCSWRFTGGVLDASTHTAGEGL